MSHVFISYKHDDAHFVDSLREKLKAAEIDSWVDTDIEAGEDWKEKIDTAIEAAFAVVVVLTPESHLSPYVTYEWSYAMGLEKQVIPILLRQTLLHPKLEGKQYLNFTQRNSPEHILIDRLNSLKKSYTPLKKHQQRILGVEYDHLQPLIDDLRSDDLDLRHAAITTLGELKAIPAVGAILECLRAQDREIRKAAAVALGKIGSEKAVPVLMMYANSRSIIGIELETAIYRSLAQIGGDDVIRFIQRNHLIDWKARWESDAASYGLVEAINLYGDQALDEGIRQSIKSFTINRLNILISDTHTNIVKLDRLKAQKPLIKFITHTNDFDELYEYFHLDKEELLAFRRLATILDTNDIYEKASTKISELEEKFDQLIAEESAF